MRKNTLKTWLVAINILLFGLNFTPVLAQVLEIEVMGGGYRLRGPDLVTFPNVAASFEEQESVRDMRDLNTQDEEAPSSINPLDYVLIEDQNGGNAFNVSVSAETLVDTSKGQKISNARFYIRNKNGTGSNIVPHNAYSSTEGVTLHTDTNSFSALNVEKTLFNGDGKAPGAWRIFPVFKIVVPGETVPGTYKSTITFTVI
jgi:hypothetical protein